MLAERKFTKSAGAVHIPCRAFYVFQFAAVTILIVLAVARHGTGALQGSDMLELFTRMFDLDMENSVPTWFSMLNLLISSVLLFAIYRHNKDRGEALTVYWLALSALFFALSAEEIIGMHERATKFQSVTGVLIPVIQTNSWLLYGAAFALLTFLFFIPFLLRLDRRTALLFLLSGGVFLSGALGFEFVQALTAYRGMAIGQEPYNRLYMILEEGGEMYGVAIFNCTLFARIVSQRITLTLRTGSDQAVAP